MAGASAREARRWRDAGAAYLTAAPSAPRPAGSEILATIHQWQAGGITAGKRHMMAPWRIDVQGDRATSVSSYWVVNAQDGTTIVATGGYVDEITRRDGVWWLQRRVQTIDPSFKT